MPSSGELSRPQLHCRACFLIRGSRFDNHSESTLLRYLHDEPGVSERLASGAERASLADAEAELDAMMRRYGYSARTGVEKL